MASNPLYKVGDRVRVLGCSLDKIDRIGKVYPVSTVVSNGVIVEIDKNTFMAIQNCHIEPEKEDPQP